MARKRERVVMGFLAILFLFTSSAVTIAVIWQSTHSNDQSTSNSDTATQQTKPAKQSKLPNFTPVSTPLAKLQVDDTKKGTGATVQAGDTVTVDYTGALMKTGVIFDSSAQHGGSQPISLKQVIPGWSKGIPGMKVGGTRRLLIPADQAYGPQAQSTIPANSDLVFDVTVTKIDK